MESSKLFKDQKIKIHEQGEKMSEVLALFIAPYTRSAPNYEAYHRLVAIAVIAWNAALLEKIERNKFLDEMRKALPNDKTTQQDFTDLDLRTLITNDSNKRITRIFLLFYSSNSEHS
ncbi:MAG: hypothetical protein AABZ78_18115 [Chloroflexota bacterium]